MNIYCVQISDLHLKSTDKQWCEKKTSILLANLSLEVKKEDCIIVVATGDLSNWGLVGEFEIVNYFFNHLKNSLSQICGRVEFAIIPGNHDCYLGEENDVRDTIIQSIIEGKPIKDGLVKICLESQSNFFQFLSDFYGSPMSPSICWNRTIEYEGLTITVNCLNTAWMSTKDESEKNYGKLIMPENLKEFLQVSDLTISLLHHPYNWFSQSVMHSLRQAIEESSDLIFTGHEHQPHLSSPMLGSESKHFLFASKDGKDAHGNFNYSITSIDLAKKTFSNTIFTDTKRTKTIEDVFTKHDSLKKYKYPLSADYLQKNNRLHSEIFHHRKDVLQLDDIFVYPRVKTIAQDEEVELDIQEYATYIKNLTQKGMKFIFGEKYSGKSSLAKVLTQDFCKNGKYVLYVNIEDLSTQHCRSSDLVKFLDEKSREMYGDISLHEVPLEDRVVLIDGVGSVVFNNNLLVEILNMLNEMFSTVIVFADDTFKALEISDFVELQFDEYEIEPFKGREIIQLIEKWLIVGGSHKYNEDHDFHIKFYLNIIRQASESSLIPSFPFYIILLLNNAQALGTPDTDAALSSTDLIDRMIRLNLLKLILPQLGSGGVVNFLSYLAYAFFKSAKYKLLDTEMETFIEYYKAKHRVKFDQKDVLDQLCRKGILKKENDQFKFKDDFIIYYFIGKYFSNNLNDENVSEEFKNLILKCYREDYSNIINFISFFSSDLSIFHSVILETKKILEGREEIRLDKDIQSLSEKISADIKTIKLVISDKNDHKDELAKMTDTEKDISLKQHFIDHGVEETNLVLVVLRHIQTLGQMVKNKSGSLDGDTKEEAIKEIISLSSRFLDILYSSIETDIETTVNVIVKEIKEKRVLAGDNKEENDDYYKNAAKKSIFIFLQKFTLHIVEKVSFFSGAESLRNIFNDLSIKEQSNYYKLCEINVELDHCKELRINKLKELNNSDFHKVYFAKSLLRLAIYKYMLTNKTDLKIRQQLCEEFDINLNRITLLTEKNKTQKN